MDPLIGGYVVAFKSSLDTVAQLPATVVCPVRILIERRSEGEGKGKGRRTGRGEG